jgi:hypothetical protein
LNLIWDMERPIFLPKSIILERMGHFHTSSKKSVFLNLVKLVRYANIFPVCLCNLVVWYTLSLNIFSKGIAVLLQVS